MRIIIPFVAVVVSMALIGICSVWLGGSARIPFVMGADSALPGMLGRIHPRWGTPYVALIGQSVIASLLILGTLLFRNVPESYAFLLNGSLIIQLVPFLYLFLGLLKDKKRQFSATIGLLSTLIAILFFVIPGLQSTGAVLGVIVPPVVISVIAAVVYRARRQIV